MTGIAVLKVDDLGRRPLLITGVSGIVSYSEPNIFCYIIKVHAIRFSTYFMHTSFISFNIFHLAQALSLLLLSAYYKFLGGFPLVAVAALLLYVGSYQVLAALS